MNLLAFPIKSLYTIIIGIARENSRKNMDFSSLQSAVVHFSHLPHIASSVGYEDPLCFSRVFRQMFGISPTEYRSRLSTKTFLTILRSEIVLNNRYKTYSSPSNGKVHGIPFQDKIIRNSPLRNMNRNSSDIYLQSIGTLAHKVL